MLDPVLAQENALDAADGITHHWVEVNGLRLHCAMAGRQDRPLMLMLHGFPEFWFAWREPMKALSRHYRVVAPDLRGFNLSDKPADVKAYRIGPLIEDIRQLMDRLGPGPCILVAHDWGGAVAWNFAARHPDRVSRLVILNAPHNATFVRELCHNPLQQAASHYMLLHRSPLAEDLMSRNQHAFLSAMLRTSTPDDRWFDAATEARYRKAWAQPGALTGGLNYYRASPLFPPTASERGPLDIVIDPATCRVAMPTLVIWGERDPFLLPGCLDGLQDHVPRLTLVREPASSHWIVHERPAFVVDMLRHWLGTVS